MTDWAALRKRHDPSDMFGKIRALPEQIEEAEARFRTEGASPRGGPERGVLLLGMGGSAIGGEIAAAVLRASAAVPIVVSRGRSVPAWCGPGTLAVATSYSGNTEETLSAWDEAERRGASLAAIASGGALAEKARSSGRPHVLVPGGSPPRAAIGHLAVSLLLLLAELEVAPPIGRDIEETVRLLRSLRARWNLDEGPDDGEPARIARLLEGRLPYFYYEEGESGPVAARWCGQLAENAKALSHRAAFPEGSHNEIVGWERGGDGLPITVVHLRSERSAGGPADSAGAAIDVLRAGRDLPVVPIEPAGDGPLARVFAGIYLADFTSWFLALLRGVDPTPVRSIDDLKRRTAAGRER